MGYSSIPIKTVITYFNNPIEKGGFWLPNIKKEFEWNEAKIEKFMDSIMREYPIGTILVLKTKKPIYCRRFVNTYSEGVNINTNPEAITDTQKNIVLDGQKRLQSIFVALNGSYNGKELYFNVLSGNNINQNDMKYNFKFINEAEKENYWIKVKDVIKSDKKPNVNKRNIIKQIEKEIKEDLSVEIKDRIDDNLDRLIDSFTINDAICYAVLDDVENEGIYTSIDICDIVESYNSIGSKFIREDLVKALDNF